MITIRRTTGMDIIRQLDARLIGTDVDEPSASHLWWLAHVDGKLAGYCGLAIFVDEGGKGAFLSRSGVLKEFRGQGLQKRMIRVREMEARRRGCSHIVTYTARYNMPSANSLIRSGYSLYESCRAWGVKDALYFQKRLR